MEGFLMALSYSCRSCCGESLTCLTTTSPLGAESSVDARSGKFHSSKHALRKIGPVSQDREMRIKGLPKASRRMDLHLRTGQSPVSRPQRSRGRFVFYAKFTAKP